MRSVQADNTARAVAVADDSLDEVPAQRVRPAAYVGSEVFRRAAFGTRHPLNIVRHAAVVDLLESLGWLEDAEFHVAPQASVDELATFHDREYIAALQEAAAAGTVAPDLRARYSIGTLENPLFPGLFERAATTVGGSILAARLAVDGHVAFHPSGGTHHGRPDRASGFCYFNDPVFAIRTLLDEGCGRVLYVDLDAHHGDGVEAAFAREARVMTVSVHECDRWPYSGRVTDRGNGNARNLPVPKEINDSELDHLVQHALLPIADRFDPEALVLCCGADCLAGDPLSGMMLSNTALWAAVTALLDPDRPTVVLGGGGYNPWTVARYWAGMWGILSGRKAPMRLPDRAISLLRDMECDLVDEDDVDPAWFTTLADAPNPGPVRDEIVRLARSVTG